MKRFLAYVSALGQNIQFVAFFAHAGVAALAVEHCRYPLPGLLLVWVGGAVKEFYFDARYEQSPPQTFADNLEDWLGWAVGALAGFALARTG